MRLAPGEVAVHDELHTARDDRLKAFIHICTKPVWYASGFKWALEDSNL